MFYPLYDDDTLRYGFDDGPYCGHNGLHDFLKSKAQTAAPSSFSRYYFFVTDAYTRPYGLHTYIPCSSLPDTSGRRIALPVGKSGGFVSSGPILTYCSMVLAAFMCISTPHVSMHMFAMSARLLGST